MCCLSTIWNWNWGLELQLQLLLVTVVDPGDRVESSDRCTLYSTRSCDCECDMLHRVSGTSLAMSICFLVAIGKAYAGLTDI